jgi:hypothetical protein
MKVHGQQRLIQLRHLGADEPDKLACLFRCQNPDRIGERDTRGPGRNSRSIATAKKLGLRAARVFGRKRDHLKARTRVLDRALNHGHDFILSLAQFEFPVQWAHPEKETHSAPVRRAPR